MFIYRIEKLNCLYQILKSSNVKLIEIKLINPNLNQGKRIVLMLAIAMISYYNNSNKINNNQVKILMKSTKMELYRIKIKFMNNWDIWKKEKILKLNMIQMQNYY